MLEFSYKFCWALKAGHVFQLNSMLRKEIVLVWLLNFFRVILGILPWTHQQGTEDL